MAGFHSEETDHLFRALLSLRTEEECCAFFEDICTIRELREMSQRLEVARQLRAGRLYSEIAAATGASTATISRVNRCLSYGAGGYTLALQRLEEAEKVADADKEKNEKSGAAGAAGERPGPGTQRAAAGKALPPQKKK